MIKVNELCVAYDDYLSFYEISNNFLYLSNLKRFGDIVNVCNDPNGRYEKY